MAKSLPPKGSQELLEIFDYVDNNSLRFIEELRELIRQPSVSAQNVGMMECAQLLQRKMIAAGMKASIMPTDGHPVVFGETKSEVSGATILFYGHYDVVPPEPIEQWQSPPFEADLRNGRIYGRGASDMKCGVMALIKAMESYHKVRGSLPINVKFIFEGEEEIGSPHLEHFVRENKQLLAANAMAGYDGTAEVRLGKKGLLYVELSLKEERTDFHSREAAILMSPTWRLVWALSTMKDQHEKVTIDGFYDDVREPTAEDMNLLERIPFEPAKLYAGRLLEGLVQKQDVLRHRMFSPTCNISGIVSGYTGTGAKTVLPSVASAKIDFRLVSDQNPEDIFEKLKCHLSKYGFGDISVAKISQAWPSSTSVTEKIAKAVIESAEVAHRRRPTVIPVHAGSDPSWIFKKHLNLPYAFTGAATTPTCNHAPNEYVEVEDYLAGIKKGAAIIYNFSSA